MTSLRDSIEIYYPVKSREYDLLSLCRGNVPDLSVYWKNPEFPYEKICERSLCWPGSDSFLSAKRLKESFCLLLKQSLSWNKY